MDVDIDDIDMVTRPRRRGPPRSPFWKGSDHESINLQKEILWIAVTEAVVHRDDLIERFDDHGDVEVDVVIEAMVSNGLLEEINDYLRVHQNFAENCYAIIR